MRHNYQFIFTLQVIENKDNPAEYYQLFSEGSDFQIDRQPLLKAARFLDSFFLWEVPFVVMFSDFEKDQAMDIGWNIYLAKPADWESVHEKQSNSLMILNQRAIENIDLFSKQKIPFLELFDDANLHLFFIPFKEIAQ